MPRVHLLLLAYLAAASDNSWTGCPGTYGSRGARSSRCPAHAALAALRSAGMQPTFQIPMIGTQAASPPARRAQHAFKDGSRPARVYRPGCPPECDLARHAAQVQTATCCNRSGTAARGSTSEWRCSVSFLSIVRVSRENGQYEQSSAGMMASGRQWTPHCPAAMATTGSHEGW
jgi:hypothetical protein